MWALILSASGQAFDAHGPTLPPDSASVSDPVSTFHAGRPAAPTFTLLGEGASGLLVREVREGPFVRVEPVVDSIFGANLGGVVGIAPRLSIAASVPLWMGVNTESGTAPALGDFTVWLPVHLVDLGDRFAADVIPFGRLPTGAAARYLGDPAGGGVRASARARAGWLVGHVDGELEVRGATGSETWRGGPTGLVAAALGLVPHPRFGAHLELRARAPLGGSPISVPSEALLTLKGRPSERVFVTMSGGAAVTRGVGAGLPRFMFGATFALGSVPTEEVGPRVASVDGKELRVVDGRGFPIQGAEVVVGGLTLLTDADGFADLPLKALERGGPFAVRHPAYVERDLTGLDREAAWWEVALDRRPVPVLVSVVGPNGEPMKTAELKLVQVGDAAADPGPMTADDLGVRRWELAPGTTWVVTMTARNLGGQARVISIPPQRTEPIRVDVVLAWAVDPSTRLTIRVVDGVGAPVEDVAVAIEGRDFGTTGPGGELTIQGLPRGEQEVTVRSSAYGEATIAKAEVGDDAQLEVVLEWPPGAVLAKAVGPNGEPVDAWVSFGGPVSLPARSLGSDGQQVFVLRPGQWTLRLTAEGFAPQERTLDIDERPGDLRQLDVVFQPQQASGTASVVVRAQDPSGAPVAGVLVAFDGREVGRTGPNGELVLLDLAPGERRVTAGGELLRPVDEPFEIVEGRQVLDLGVRWVDGVVDLVATRGDAVADAEVRIEGDRPITPVRTGPDGAERVVLSPGTWRISAESEDGARTESTLVVPEGRGVPQSVALDLAAARSEAPGDRLPARIALTGPDGPVSGKVVLAHAESGETVVVAVDGVGQATLEPGAWSGVATSPGMAPAEVSIAVQERQKRPPSVEAKLQPVGPGAAVALMVEDASGAPVEGARVLVGDQEVGLTNAAGLAIVSGGKLKDAPEMLRVEPTTPGLDAIEVPTRAATGRAFVVPDAAQVVSVQVSETGGGVVAGASVTALGPTGQVASGTADAEGRVELELTPGSWTITAGQGANIGSVAVPIPRGEAAPAVSVALEPVQARLVGGQLVLARPVLFDLGRAELRRDAAPVLDDVARMLKADRRLALIEVAGHTDDIGGPGFNQQLSERRAAAVRDALIARGVERERLIRRGYGLSRPASPGTDEASRQLNRRVELVVLETGAR